VRVDHPGNGSLRLSNGRAILVLIPAPVGSDNPDFLGLSLVTDETTYVNIPRDDAVTLGRWLLETFGEET